MPAPERPITVLLPGGEKIERLHLRGRGFQTVDGVVKVGGTEGLPEIVAEFPEALGVFFDEAEAKPSDAAV